MSVLQKTVMEIKRIVIYWVKMFEKQSDKKK